MLNAPEFDRYDLSRVEVMMTGGASCPIEVIREVRDRLPGQLLEMYGMLECGTQAHTLLTDDPEEVCGTGGPAGAGDGGSGWWTTGATTWGRTRSGRS